MMEPRWERIKVRILSGITAYGLAVVLLLVSGVTGCGTAVAAEKNMEKNVNKHEAQGYEISAKPDRNNDSQNILGQSAHKEDQMITITLQIGDQDLTAKLYQNPAAEKLMEQFPVTFTMNELHGNEKFVYMDDSLPTDAKAVKNIRAGDLMLFGSDCLVLFYSDFPTAYSYTSLGYVENGEIIKELLGNGNVEITLKNKIETGEQK